MKLEVGHAGVLAESIHYLLGNCQCGEQHLYSSFGEENMSEAELLAEILKALNTIRWSIPIFAGLIVGILWDSVDKRRPK